MSAAKTAREFVRIATSQGLAKNVIDLLDKKASLLVEQVSALEQENTTLLRENRSLRLENENLQKQPQNARPKRDELPAQTTAILKAFFGSARDLSAEEIALQLQISRKMAGNHLDILMKKKFIQVMRMGSETSQGRRPPLFGILPEGKEYIVEND